jgi:DNA-binding XRE family transcriptional regulator
MTTPNTNSLNASSPITRPSSTKVAGQTVSTGTVRGNVVSLLVPPLERREAKRGFINIDDLVALEEATPEGRAEVAEARRELSESLVRQQGASLKALRLSRGLSQAKLGELVGTSQAHIARIENAAQDIQLNTVERIAAALAIEPLELAAVFLQKSRNMR